MDLNTARHVLRLDPLAPLTAEAVETAYAREAWARHPSRYPDAASFEAATAWAGTLAEAREALLRSMTVSDATASGWSFMQAPPASGAAAPPEPAAGAPATNAPMTSVPTSAAEAAVAPRRRRRVGLLVGIAAAGLGVIAVFVATGIGAAKLAEQLGEAASALDEPTQTYSPQGVETFSADDMYFTFPAAMEAYTDGRYTKFCALEFEYGCWETALITEASCAALEIDLHFSNDAEAWTGEHIETMSKADVLEGAITPVVFGHDGYDFGWIHDVRCVDSTAPASSQATVPGEPESLSNAAETPLRRDESAQFTAEQTGFWVPATLEMYADGRLGECPPEFERGCWQAAVIPQSSCQHLEIQYSFGNGRQSEQTRSTSRINVIAGEPIELVFGHDRYEFGWVSHAGCLS